MRMWHINVPRHPYGDDAQYVSINKLPPHRFSLMKQGSHRCLQCTTRDSHNDDVARRCGTQFIILFSFPPPSVPSAPSYHIVIIHSHPQFMSRKLRSVLAGAAPTTPTTPPAPRAPRGRKRLQSNAKDTMPKCSKTDTTQEDQNSDKDNSNRRPLPNGQLRIRLKMQKACLPISNCENGIICAADNHACNECTQKHRKTSDVVDVVFDDPAAVVGVDATDDDIPALVTAHEEPEVDLHQGDEMDIDNIRDTNLVTLDGVVMGPQVCEQLNAWLGGYQSILKCMTPGNFNWFLHSMLFYHTKYVLQKQLVKKKREEDAEELMRQQEEDAEEEEGLGLDEEIVEEDEEDE
ncbi:uncharacterized protein LACBIDRAFT_335649 [Laccaria bicolor S238N-H82]|uniref:Predicted protein n=1 Tax=Laccaria bicolor (strain S238N-H82 / ATCC MYA-4686) TaxID=486041 RepID=B0E2Y6_LACBS|nr:uncharacterized protein LACBIDRAFT_335649 [Laccaria bicolor S238N-H82]EDQ98795.1 predicted protein [Laccaria bicolor S238N-H82]|eukprot:XP_001890554.1 predicted protein [Laccaria bicolor S238N-H82]